MKEYPGGDWQPMEAQGDYYWQPTKDIEGYYAWERTTSSGGRLGSVSKYDGAPDSTGQDLSEKGSSSSAAKAGAMGSAAALGGPIGIAAIAAFQIWSGIQQANMVRRQADLTKKVSDLNASYADLDAYEADKFGYTEAARMDSQVDQVIGQQRATMAAKNIDINSGTASEIQAESRINGFLNRLDVLNDAHLKASGYRRQAENIRLQGSLNRGAADVSAEGAQLGGFLNAASTGISYYARK